MKNISVDIIIFGGGIAGLWALSQLKKSGYSVLLCEKNSLGGGQTIYAQGMLHGGLKYTISGKATEGATSSAKMPEIWEECLSGNGIIDLTKTKVLKRGQVFWAPGKISGAFKNNMATKLLSGEAHKAQEADWPALFKQTKKLDGSLFELEETVIDIPSLIKNLREQNAEDIFQADSADMDFEVVDGVVKSITYQDTTIHPQAVILTAGQGNVELAEKMDISLNWPKMQLRPLRQVMVKNIPEELYGHCVGNGFRPRATISTHYTKTGEPVWYIGANIAEQINEGKTEEETIQFAKKELADLFPWVDFSKCQWATCEINRAEPEWDGGLMPPKAHISEVGSNILCCWPTKLTFAPQLAMFIEKYLQDKKLSPQNNGKKPVDWNLPPIAENPWDTAHFKEYA
jgi:glycine/D-amino acid oxidase-like deaminating enzyme